MKQTRAVVVLFFLAAVASAPASAISIRSLLGLDDDESEAGTLAAEESAQVKTQATQAAASNWGKASNPNAVTELDLEVVKRLMANLEAGQRDALLADEAAFMKFVRQQANNLSVLEAARANKLEDDANTAFLMQRGAENILREIYLDTLIKEKLPADFPNDEQLKEYYEKNQENFVIPERVHVWQIFFPVIDGMDEKARAALRKQASEVAAQIDADKIAFEDAATRYSKHTPSNANGGYMGLIKSADLKPEIKEVVLKLEEGKISKLLTTDTGLHIVKRGALVAARKIELEDGKEQIANLLVRQVRNQLRQAIFEQAALKYPVDLPDTKIEEWRLRLRTKVAAPATK